MASHGFGPPVGGLHSAARHCQGWGQGIGYTRGYDTDANARLCSSALALRVASQPQWEDESWFEHGVWVREPPAHYDTSGCSSQGLSWSPSNRYLNRSKLASTRLCNNHTISIKPRKCSSWYPSSYPAATNGPQDLLCANGCAVHAPDLI